VICSHGFLSQFTPTQRADLARAWWRMLAPKGTVLAVNRVRSDSPGAETKFSEQQGRAYCELIAEKLQRVRSLEEADKAAILARAGVYVQNLKGYSLLREELTALFSAPCFQLDDVKIVSSGTQDTHLSGPAVPALAQHACIVASKA
jgi:hypothetical protein